MKKISKARIRPTSSLNLLSHKEIQGVINTGENVFDIFRDCALAVLNTGNELDDITEIDRLFNDFDIEILPESRGIKLEVINAPASAFVDGTMIRGIQEHLFAALRDIVYTQHKINRGARFDMESGVGRTDAVFRILRNAGVVQANKAPNLVVCWGGHSIDRMEYDYAKSVGYQLGLRGFDVATGCGIGAMKGPMKGAAVGHGKQQIHAGRYVGITEPGIISSESPNPTVNELVILPDIEKRLEAFVRLAHSIVVFPGGAGTAEEVLYLLGIVMHPSNQDIPMPMVFAAPEGRELYFQELDRFIRSTLGEEAASRYEIVVGQPEKVAQLVRRGIEQVARHRRRVQESYAYNWNLNIIESLQEPFEPIHKNMEALHLSADLEPHELAAQLRCAFSGIVAGNVKAFGIEQVQKHGPYKMKGDKKIMQELDSLLQAFIKQGRMKLGTSTYKPCFEVVK